MPWTIVYHKVMEQLSVIIVNWNTGKLLRLCLESLERLPEKSMVRHVLIIDNASSDNSLMQAKTVADRAGFTILTQSENLGFTKANNIGIKYIHEHSGADDHILLLNPDTIVHPHAIENMLTVLLSDTSIGIVGPKLLEANGDIQPSVRLFPTLSIFILLFIKLHRIFSNTKTWRSYMMADFDYTKQQNVDQVMGAALLIRNTLLQQIGLLDEGFWIWFEEVDYCKCTQDAGFAVLYTPHASITHYKGTSFNQLVGLTKTQPLLNSSLRYAQKHLGIVAYIVLLILYPLALIIAALASGEHMRQKKVNTSRL